MIMLNNLTYLKSLYVNSSVFLVLTALVLLNITPFFNNVAYGDSGITVSTDKKYYNDGDVITIQGKVSEKLAGYPVTTQIIAASGDLTTVKQVDVSEDNTFSTKIESGGSLWRSQGTYTVKVLYGTDAVSAETTFEFSGSATDSSSAGKTIPITGYPEYLIKYSMTGGKIISVEPDTTAKSLAVTIKTTSDGEVKLMIPREVIDARNGPDGKSGNDVDFFVLVDGSEVGFDETTTASERTLTIPFQEGSNEIDIIGSYVVGSSENNQEEILAASSSDDSILAIVVPTGINSDDGLDFEISFEDSDGKPVSHINYDVIAVQDGQEILSESGVHSHTGTSDYATASLISNNPVEIEIKILGIGLPDDQTNWKSPKDDTVVLRIVDFGSTKSGQQEDMNLPLEAEVSIPAGSSSPSCEKTNECYSPYSIAIALGGEVTWTNDDSAAHTVTSGDIEGGPDGKFNSDLFLAGKTFSHKFDESGEFSYYCQVHPWMKGIVYVGQGNPNQSPIPSEIGLYTATDKSDYDLGELVNLNVNVVGISSPQNVAFTVTDPFGTIVVSRTLTTDSSGNADTNFKIAESFKTGTYHIDATTSLSGKTYSDSSEFRITSQFNQIQLVSAQGTDQQGNPVSFTRGNMGFVKVQVSAEKSIATLITVNVFDSDLTPIGVGSLKTTLSPDKSELILSFLIPENAVVGTADIYVNALSDWVSAGGIPQTGELAGQVRIN